MAVRILIANLEATVKQGKWTCENKVFEDFLSIVYRGQDIIYSPFPDLTLAEEAVKDFGGKIAKITDVPKYVAGRIY